MATTPRAQTLRFQGAANAVVRAMLRIPLLSRAVGKRLVTLYVVGRKSGKRYAVPVAYTAHEGALLIGTPFGWGRNLRTGVPLEVRYQGSRRVADVVVATEEDAVVEAYAVIARDNHSFADFNKISFDSQGNPDPADLREAWLAGARAFRLTLR
jgi:deazaflavin-dependent oxidoreductase (nitroreductase family)